MSDGPRTGTVSSSELGDDWTAQRHLGGRLERNRLTNPSINFPESAEEAFQALLHSVRNALFDPSRGALSRVHTTNAGLGTTRTQRQADWLNEQQALLVATLTDHLDKYDLARKDHS